MFRMWVKRYVVLQHTRLDYFLSEELASGGAAKAKDSIVMAGAKVRVLHTREISGRPWCIGVTAPLSKHTFVFSMVSAASRDEWLASFLTAGAHQEESKKNSTSSAAASTVFASRASLFSPLAERMFPSSAHEGYLQKLGGVQRSIYQWRYFVILGSHLLWFTKAGDTDSAKGTMNLRDCQLQIEQSSGQKQVHAFSLLPKVRKQRQGLMSLLGVLGELPLFGEKKGGKYMLRARDQTDMQQWLAALAKESGRAQTERAVDRGRPRCFSLLTCSFCSRMIFVRIERCNEAAAVSDSDDDAPPTRTNGARPPTANSANANGSAHPTPAPTVPDTEADDDPTSFTDIISHCFKLDDVADAQDDGAWKKRYLGLDIKSQTLFTWKRRPVADAAQNKPRSTIMVGAKMHVERQLRCRKVAHHPSVLTITFPASSALTPLHFAPASEARFDEWYSFLLLALGSARHHPSSDDAMEEARKSLERSQISIPPQVRSNSQPPPATNDSTERLSDDDDEEAATPVGASKSPQAQLLHEMSLVLDESSMSMFRMRSADLHRGIVTPAQYFRFYWRLFGKENGLRFWSSLIGIMPREEMKEELKEIFASHHHHFNETTTTINTSPVTPATPAPAAPVAPAPTSPAGAFTANDVNSSTPSFGSRVRTAVSAWNASAPPSPDPSVSPPVQAQAQSSATAANRSAYPTVSPAHATMSMKRPVDPVSLPAEPVSPVAATPASPATPTREELSAQVDAWALRAESHIITLLCTLHEILPSTCAAGQFIPFDDGYPTVREVKSTYLRAMRVIHPDKNKMQTAQIVRKRGE